jgi:hypothetical protein
MTVLISFSKSFILRSGGARGPIPTPEEAKEREEEDEEMGHSQPAPPPTPLTSLSGPGKPFILIFPHLLQYWHYTMYSIVFNIILFAVLQIGFGPCRPDTDLFDRIRTSVTGS